jgi:molybdenum cofactor biosynthesis enzyme MoaA
MTYGLDVKLSTEEVNWRNFGIAARFAKEAGVNTVMLTGKGEPTLFPDQITEYLEHLQEFRFPFVELQTNGLKLHEKRLDGYLRQWYDLGLTTVAVSVAHYDNAKNKEIFTSKEEYPDLEKLVEKLHKQKYSVRMACVMVNGYIDNVKELDKLVDFAKKNDVEQLTVRPIRKPGKSRSDVVAKWVEEHGLSDDALREIKNYLDHNATKLLELMHGAIVYDYRGQNVCLTDALTIEPETDKIRQLIFFPDGHLRYDWQYKGAILI